MRVTSFALLVSLLASTATAQVTAKADAQPNHANTTLNVVVTEGSTVTIIIPEGSGAVTVNVSIVSPKDPKKGSAKPTGTPSTPGPTKVTIKRITIDDLDEDRGEKIEVDTSKAPDANKKP